MILLHVSDLGVIPNFCFELARSVLLKLAVIVSMVKKLNFVFFILRVAEEEKSLEDKADIVMKHLEEKRNSTKPSHRIRDFMSPLSHYDSTSKGNSGPVPLPEHPLHHAQYLASTHTSGTTVETSMAAFYFVIASIVLVMLVMVRYVHSGRRTHTIFRTRFRL